jgi:glycosyltransferase domain-containing protein
MAIDHGGEARLTLIIPTRDRPRHCAAQLRFLRACGFAAPIIVADSSEPEQAGRVREACAGVARHLALDPEIGVFDKLAAATAAVETPFVVSAPDDDVTLPHGIAQSLAHLERNPDHVAAHGYVLRFGIREQDIDLHGVYSFIPTVGQPEPLQRLYHLIRRYQPFIWAVFRTEAFGDALRAVEEVDGIIFKELAFHAAAILRGKVARLPVIFSMRGMEESSYPREPRHPLFWFVDDAESFGRGYVAYRNALVRRLRNEHLATKPRGERRRLLQDALGIGFAAMKEQGRRGIGSLLRSIRNRGLATPDGHDLQQALDLIHAIWLSNELDRGIMNHSVRKLLGEEMPPIKETPAWPGWHELEEGDVVHPAAGGRRYIWRRTLLEAEPRDEIHIDADAMAATERELDFYRLE